MKRDLRDPSEIGRAYDETVDQYESAFSNARMDGKWLAQFRAALPPDADVLDLGCGPGLQSEVLSKLGCRCTGVDVSAAMVEAARSRVPQGSFETRSFLDVGAIKDEFDGILISYSLLHVSRREAREVLEACRKLLRSEGIVALFLKEGVGVEYVDAPLMDQTRLFTCLWTEGEISEMLKELGFRVVSAEVAAPESDLEFPFRKLFVMAQVPAVAPA